MNGRMFYFQRCFDSFDDLKFEKELVQFLVESSYQYHTCREGFLEPRAGRSFLAHGRVFLETSKGRPLIPPLRVIMTCTVCDVWVIACLVGMVKPSRLQSK